MQKTTHSLVEWFFLCCKILYDRVIIILFLFAYYILVKNKQGGNEMNYNIEYGMALTPQEGRVIEYICKGMTNLQIADALNIKLTTVKAHIASILYKYGAKNRVHAASIHTMKKKGLIE